MKPSEYQEAIYNWTKTAKAGSAAIVKAVPGSGKTTTIVKATEYLDPKLNALFCAFNKTIATELSTRVKVPCKTLHAIGFGLCGKGTKVRLIVEDSKYRSLFLNHLEDTNPLLNDIIKFFEMSQVTLTNLENKTEVLALFDNFGFTDDDILRFLPEMKTVLAEGIELYRSRGIISFNDMIWLPVVLGLKSKALDIILIDEAQDLNKAQATLVLSLLDPKRSRAIFVGDVNQAIYGFAGATPDSIDQIDSILGDKGFTVTQFPLSICYRCPSTHIALANAVEVGSPAVTLAPNPLHPSGSALGIEARSNAPVGVVNQFRLESELEKFIAQVRPTDLVISRVTAPLISLALKLIAARKPAKVLGRDIGSNLVSLIKKAKRRNGNFRDLLSTLNYILELCPPHRSVSLKDQIDAITVCYTEWSPVTWNDLITEIGRLFADTEQTGVITLTSIHRAKGLESDTVWLLTDRLTLSWPGQLPWQYQQELNLKYVALTRSKSILNFVAA